MHIGGLLPFHAIRTSFIRPPVELSLTELRRPFELDGKLALPSRVGRQTCAALSSRTKLAPSSRVGPDSHRPPKLDQTCAVLSSRTRLMPSSRVGPDSRRPPKSTRAVCGRLDPNGRSSRTGLRQTFRAGPCRTFSGRPAGRPAFVPVKATPTKPPVRFPRGL